MRIDPVRWLLLASGLIATAPAGAQDLASAKAFLQKLYAGYAKDASPSADLRGGTLLEPSLAELWDRAEKKEDGEVVDADPVCDCQDFEISDVAVEVQPVGASKAIAIALFKNFGKRETVRFDLIETGVGWRIADIHDPGPNVPSLRERLLAVVAPAKPKRP